ncbi:MAG: nitroreductase [Bacteroidales bacterium]|nr:nitroreductase [Bacteroidales bacterium]
MKSESYITHLRLAVNPDFLKMVECAVKAPSGHNTQPWKFYLKESAIEIHPDLSKALAVVDGNNRELYISLGCAAENLSIAAGEFGYASSFSIESAGGDNYFIKIGLNNCHAVNNRLFGEIKKRQTNRGLYEKRIISPEIINKLNEIKFQKGLKLRFFENGSTGFRIIRELVAEGNTIQMQDEAFKSELMSWIRFNKKQIQAKQNGLTYEVMGTPATPAWIGRSIVRSFLKPGKQNKTDIDKINSSSHMVLFTIERNDPETWIHLGRALEHFLLELSGAGIANAYLNQPCEVQEVALKMISALGITGEYPAVLMRLGYSVPLPYSPRKNIEEVVQVLF